MKSLELFVGAGGLALGAAQAGFTHMAVMDWDANACRTLEKNKLAGVRHVRDWSVREADVSKVDFGEYHGEVDFVFGGPPCQPFSIGGKHLGPEDPRNMFPEAVRAIREVQPVAFVFENVKGLLRSTFREYYEYTIRQLEQPALERKRHEEWWRHFTRLKNSRRTTASRTPRYKVVFDHRNAANYGVPQRRQRVFVVGVREDVDIEFNMPSPSHSLDALLHDQWVTSAYWDRHKIAVSDRPTLPRRHKTRVNQLMEFARSDLGQPWRTVRDAISDLPRIAEGETSAEVQNHFLNPGARSYPGHDGSPWDMPAKTLKAGDHGVPGGENTLRYEDGSVRYFSVRECARLQGFPDNWVFEGPWTKAMRQLGNAVPVPLAQAIAVELAGAFNDR